MSLNNKLITKTVDITVKCSYDEIGLVNFVELPVEFFDIIDIDQAEILASVKKYIEENKAFIKEGIN